MSVQQHICWLSFHFRLATSRPIPFLGQDYPNSSESYPPSVARFVGFCLGLSTSPVWIWMDANREALVLFHSHWLRLPIRPEDFLPHLPESELLHLSLYTHSWLVHYPLSSREKEPSTDHSIKLYDREHSWFDSLQSTIFFPTFKPSVGGWTRNLWSRYRRWNSIPFFDWLVIVLGLFSLVAEEKIKTRFPTVHHSNH